MGSQSQTHLKRLSTHAHALFPRHTVSFAHVLCLLEKNLLLGKWSLLSIRDFLNLVQISISSLIFFFFGLFVISMRSRHN